MKRSILFLATILFVACNDKMRFEEKHIQKELGENCKEKACVNIDLSYLHCTNGNGLFVENFNQTIISKTISLLVGSTYEEYKGAMPSTIQQASDIFLQSFEEVRQNDLESEYFSGAELTLSDSIAFNNSKFISLKRESLAFLGGVHGSHIISYYNFDTTNGQLLSSTQLFTNIQEVTKVAEKYFREQTEMTPEESFDEGGFWFEDDIFALSKNIGFDDKNLILHYNSYEIAPYSMGETTVYIPISEIKQWLAFF